MGTNIFHKTMAGTALAIVFSLVVRGQHYPDYPSLSKYSHWSVMLGGSLYSPATLNLTEGTYVFKNKPLTSGNIGIEYDFFVDRKWSVVTGVHATWEPAVNMEIFVKREDYSTNHESIDIVFPFKQNATYSLSIPLLGRYNWQLNERVFLSFYGGGRMRFLPSGIISSGYLVRFEELNESREVFAMRLETPEQVYSGGLIAGSGVSYDLDKFLLKCNVLYVMNFQNTVEGEYLFDNVYETPRSRGEYALSGNHLSLQFLISFKQNEK